MNQIYVLFQSEHKVDVSMIVWSVLKMFKRCSVVEGEDEDWRGKK